MRTMKLLAALSAFFPWPLKARDADVHYNPGWQPHEVRELTVPKLKHMLLLVENTPWDTIGSAGERSSYQITEATWKMWSLKPFVWASSYSPMCQLETETVVTKHLAYIKGLLNRQGFTHTPYNVACIWKAGEGRWAGHRMRDVDIDYAQRALNLYPSEPEVEPHP